MMYDLKKSFKLSILCVAIVCANTSVYALEELEELGDYELGEATGEGIAFLPENFSVMMNGIDTANGGIGSYGTGHNRIIPVGPLSQNMINKGYQKADLWVYGVSLAQSKDNYDIAIDSNDWGVPFGGIGTATTSFGRTINSWGTAENPWIIKTITNDSVPNFKGVNKSVAYITLEAPLRHISLTGLGEAELSAYNLKLGMWTDIFSRNNSMAESISTTSLDPALSNRLRLGIVWDGFGINGSNIKIFQTLDGVDDTNKGGIYTANLKINGVANQSRSFNYGMDKSYNQTFGMTALARLNSVPTENKRGTVSAQVIQRSITRVDYNPLSGYNSTSNSRTGNFFENGYLLAPKTGTISDAEANATNTSVGLTTTYMPMTNTSYTGPTGQNPAYIQHYPGSFYAGGYCTASRVGNSGDVTGNGAGACRYEEGFTTRRLKAFSTNTWTPPKISSVIRISTQQALGGVYDSSTPAMGGATPNFGTNPSMEGIYLYDPNINLVLGSLYQPMVLNSDGFNFSFELTRIPNVPAIYQKIYQRYEYIDPSTGTGAVDSGVNYLGATCNIYQCHNKIDSITSNYQGSTATHSSITIGATDRITTKTINGKTYTDLNQVEAHTGVGSYGVSMGILTQGTNLSGQGSTAELDLVQVWNRTRNNSFGAYGAWNVVNQKASYTSPTGHPSLHRDDPYETTYRQNYNNQVLGIQSTMPVTTTGANGLANTLNNMAPVGSTVSNNFGSSAIDGLLIQHFKFSTTGLNN